MHAALPGDARPLDPQILAGIHQHNVALLAQRSALLNGPHGQIEKPRFGVAIGTGGQIDRRAALSHDFFHRAVAGALDAAGRHRKLHQKNFQILIDVPGGVAAVLSDKRIVHFNDVLKHQRFGRLTAFLVDGHQRAVVLRRRAGIGRKNAKGHQVARAVEHRVVCLEGKFASHQVVDGSFHRRVVLQQLLGHRTIGGQLLEVRGALAKLCLYCVILIGLSLPVGQHSAMAAAAAGIFAAAFRQVHFDEPVAGDRHLARLGIQHAFSAYQIDDAIRIFRRHQVSAIRTGPLIGSRGGIRHAEQPTICRSAGRARIAHGFQKFAHAAKGAARLAVLHSVFCPVTPLTLLTLKVAHQQRLPRLQRIKQRALRRDLLQSSVGISGQLNAALLFLAQFITNIRKRLFGFQNRCHPRFLHSHQKVCLFPSRPRRARRSRASSSKASAPWVSSCIA